MKLLGKVQVLVFFAIPPLLLVHGFASFPKSSIQSHRAFGLSSTWFTEDYSFNKVPKSEKLPESLVLVDAFYDVNDEDAVRTLIEEVSEKCKQEEGCLFISWHEEERVGEGEKKLVLKGGFTDGAAVKNHYADVGWLREHLRKGPAALQLLELHGTDRDLEVATQATSKLDDVRVLAFSRSGKYEMKKEHA